jgi:hypothetical protein
VEAWRLQQLLEAGFPMPIAERIAARLDVDLRRAIALAGCPLGLVAEIVL